MSPQEHLPIMRKLSRISSKNRRNQLRKKPKRKILRSRKLKSKKKT